MSPRFTPEQIDAWRRDGGVLVEAFFTPEEVAAVQADFGRVFGDAAGADQPLVKTADGQGGAFHAAQFRNLDSIPFDGCHALNLIGLHPALIAFARAALGVEEVYLYQCQAWAKYTGAADYDQPFHCDYLNHTLVAPSEDTTRNTCTVMCYFSDVTEGHGPMHYVPRPLSEPIAPPEATIGGPPEVAELHRRLAPHARSTAGPAGSIFPYSIDLYHRGTNLTAPGGVRYAVTACFKRAGDDSIAFTAWPFHHMKPWGQLFARATADQLACLGVPRPGDPFWTETTLARAQRRYPDWDLAPYRAALLASA
ncbi:phytanoyl-CoA dioxygenase family protein [Phenylobacterium soli]|uniref:Phytanoyl-CoA dioxygenase family protein n=1 Tax=Phenylobacterium soli TaxID=2170551 RepID=A0A328AM70_9CAUL|nr:phytanoyl-CoA dioxygenase family protein [Phenylobacterium soli]RAK53978.1 hypothetical protein DJ017_05305 [Phenylobacterium soli]